jgi:hypothetical protein
MRSSRVTPNTVGTPNEWNALHEDARGASRLLAHQMYGTLALPTNPTVGQIITFVINGTSIVLTCVATLSGAAAGSFLKGATAAATDANLFQLLLNPTITNSTQVAIGTNTSANVTFINYIAWSLSGTSIIASSNAFSLYTPDTSFSASTNITGGSYTANTLALFIEPGVVYVNGTEVYFTGGVTGTITAPVSHPRIDVLSIDNTGTLNWTTGTENASPTTPLYPANQIPICELYNVVGETALYDQSNQHTGQGYIYNDVRPFLSTGINLAAVPDSIIPSADGTYNLGGPSFEWNNIYAKTAVYVNGIPIGSGKFGGTGADGALSISSGTTTIDCANAAIVVKNYTSISITGTGKLAFINPNVNGTIIILKSQAGVTLTSSSTPMIDASGMGAAGGAALTFSTGGISTVNGNTGNPGYAQIVSTNGGTGTGTAGAAASTTVRDLSTLLLKYPLSWTGAGGGSGQVTSGSGVSATSGAGGTGGGGLIIECAGAWNFTTNGGISVAGANGANGTTVSGGFAAGSGGGGGGGGFFLCLYGSLSSNSGSVTVSGGTGGNTTGSAGPSTGGGGGSNAHSLASAGTAVSSGAQSGGNGATGLAIIAQNTDYS